MCGYWVDMVWFVSVQFQIELNQSIFLLITTQSVRFPIRFGFKP